MAYRASILSTQQNKRHSQHNIYKALVYFVFTEGSEMSQVGIV